MFIEVYQDIVFEGGVAVGATMRTWFYFIPLLLAMMVSGFFSMINGFVVSIFKVHPFLATLGGSVALYGILLLYFNAYTIINYK